MKPEGQNLIARYLDGPSDENLQGELRRYLEANPDEVAEFLELLRDHAALSSALAGDENRLPSLVMTALNFRKTREQFTSGVEEALRVNRARRRASPRRPRGWGARFVVPAAVAAGALFGLVLLLNRPGPGPARPNLRKAEPARTDEARREAEEERKREEARLADFRRREEDARKEPDKAKDEDLRRKAEAEFARIQAELRAAEAKKLEAAKARPGTEEKPSPPPSPQEKPKTQSAVAKLGPIEGEVYLLAGDERRPAKQGDDLRPGQGIATAGGPSVAVVLFPDATRLRVGPNSELRDFHAEAGKRLFVTRGMVRAQVAKQPKDQPMIFASPHGEATVLGTTLRIVVDLDPKKGVRLEVEEGLVRLKNSAGKTANVPSGHFAVAATGIEPAPKRLPVEDVLLYAANAVVTGPDWRVVNDDTTPRKQALEATRTVFPDPDSMAKYVTYVKTNASRVVFRFRAESDRDYQVWLRGQWKGGKNGSVTVLAPDGRFANPCPWLGSSFENAFLFDFFSRNAGYWWVGGNEHDGANNRVATLRFARSGEQTLVLYASEPLRIDAVWLSATQKVRPEAAQIGPVEIWK